MKKVLLPDSLEALWRALETYPLARLFAGGTDLLVHLHVGRTQADVLLGLERLAELNGIRAEDDGIWIGAVTPLSQVIADAAIAQFFPVLTAALKTIGGPAIRNMATLGGNICTASPAGDSLPALHVLDAEVLLRSGKGARTLPLREFILGPGKTALAVGEVLAGIRLPRATAYNVQHFEKLGQRQAHAIAIASLAVCADVADDGAVRAIRCAWGSVGPRIVEADAVHAALLGQPLSMATITNAAAQIRKVVTPIDDIRATADYRRQIAGNLLFRLLA